MEGGGVFWVTLVTHLRGLDTRMFPKEGTARPCPLGGGQKIPWERSLGTEETVTCDIPLPHHGAPCPGSVSPSGCHLLSPGATCALTLVLE